LGVVFGVGDEEDVGFGFAIVALHEHLAGGRGVVNFLAVDGRRAVCDDGFFVVLGFLLVRFLFLFVASVLFLVGFVAVLLGAAGFVARLLGFARIGLFLGLGDVLAHVCVNFVLRRLRLGATCCPETAEGDEERKHHSRKH